jgi:tetratricopeptide (TPR) repeat protein
MPNDNLAAILLEQAEQARQSGDRTRMLDRAGEAEFYARRAVDAKPDQHTARGNLAEALRLQDEYDEALTHIRKAIDLADHLAEYHWQLGRLHELRGEIDSAIDAYGNAVQRAPDVSSFRMDLARLLMQQQRFDEAARQYRAVVDANANHIQAMANLAIARQQQQRFADAHRLYEQIVQQRLPATVAAQVIPRYIRFLTDCPDEQYRDHARALELANRLNNMAGGNDPGAMSLLATVHAKMGDYEQAINITQQALALAERHSLSDLVSHLHSQIAQYEQQRDEAPQ